MKNTRLKRFYVVFTIYAMAISLCCIMCATKKEFSISAGGYGDGYFYKYAPAYVAGGGTMDDSTGQITGTVKSLFNTTIGGGGGRC